MISCTFENLNGLGFDTSSADDSIDTDDSYVSD